MSAETGLGNGDGSSATVERLLVADPTCGRADSVVFQDIGIGCLKT